LVDEQLVPSKAGKEAFIRGGAGSGRVHVLPPPLTEIVRDRNEVHEQEKKGAFHFLAIFKWEERKNWRALLKAYWTEFLRKDERVRENVVLVVRTSPNQNEMDEWARKVAKELNSDIEEFPEIIWKREPLSASDMGALYGGSDAFVHVSYGEGWGMPLFEAFGWGMPVIASTFGGPSDYVTEENAYVIRSQLVDAFDRGHLWGEIDGIKLRERMRYVYENPKSAKGRGTIGMKDISTRFSSQSVAGSLMTRLRYALQIGRQRHAALVDECGRFGTFLRPLQCTTILSAGEEEEEEF